jgi:hypothetical protein
MTETGHEQDHLEKDMVMPTDGQAGRFQPIVWQNSPLSILNPTKLYKKVTKVSAKLHSLALLKRYIRF